MYSGVYPRLLFVTLMLVGSTAMPAGGGHHHDGSIPWDLVAAQTFNFLLFVGIIVFIIKKYLVPVFPVYRQKFIEESTKAEREMAEVEKKRKEIEDRLSKLETTYSSRLEQAKKESVEYKNNLIQEAKRSAEKTVKDASENALAAFKSTERQFKMMVLEKALSRAKEDLPKEIGENEIQRLHNEFLEEIRVNP